MKRTYTIFTTAITLLFVAIHLPTFANVTSGTYTVGTGGTYSTLSDAIADLNSSTITGPVAFNILAGSYSGSAWQAQIGNVSGGSSTNRVTIQAQDGPGSVTISVSPSSSSNYIIQFNDASFVSVKNLRLTTTSTSYGKVIEFKGGASNDSVLGCTLTGATGSTTSTNRSIVYADNANGMSDNVIYSDTIQNGSYGIYWYGSSSSGSSGQIFDNNKFVNNYYGYIYTQYLSGGSMQNNICTRASTSGTFYGFYHNYPVNGITIKNNTVNSMSTSGNVYGVYIYYGNYYTQSGPDMVVENNNMTLTGTSYVYGIDFEYYAYNMSVKNNTIVDQTGSSYNYGLRFYYFCTNLNCQNNNLTVINTSGSYCYPLYMYYMNYNNQTNGYCEFANNTITATNNGGSGYIYAAYCYYSFNMNVHNNIFNATTNYYMYNYGPLYYAFNSTARNNTFNFTNNGYGNIYNYAANIYNSSATTDSFENNTINLNCPNGASIYNYACYYLPTGSLVKDNEYNMNTNYGYIYNYSYYGNGGRIQNNKFKMQSVSGDVYGAYVYNYSSYSGANWVGNTFDLTSQYGSLYAFGGYMPGSEKFFSNIFTTKTGGASYLWYEPSYYGAQTDVFFFNNTFHSNSTGYADYLIYKTGGGSYSGKNYFFNNIFSSSNPSGCNGVVIRDTVKFIADYNLYYSVANDVSFQNQTSPSITTTSLDAWRAKTRRDRNSLIYNPGYTDAANKDFHPFPLNPNSWSVQGRGNHYQGDTLDLAGNPRPKTRQQGVPDLGAYEFTPSATPPNCIASPVNPVANTAQVFTFGGDTVASIAWGSSVPATATMKQYTGLQATAPMPSLVPRAYFTINLNTGGSVLYQHTPTVYYKDPWLGNISTETNARIARSTNNGPWEGYNFGNAITDSILDIAYPKNPFDSIGAYTIVENARIGIRCVVEPTNVKVSNITAFTADANWDPVFLPIGYQVIVDTKPGTPASGAGALFTSTNSMSLSALTENTDYYLHVRSICGVKDTSGWTTVAFSTLITCHTPEVKITALTQHRAIAYWDTVKTATKYEYVIQTEPTPEPTFGTTTTNNTLYINIEPGKQYYVFVRAFCNSIYPQSDWGQGSFMTFPTQVGTVDNNVNVTAYPNPAKETLTLAVSNPAANGSVIITDAAGQTVLAQKISTSVTALDVKQLASGLYLLKYTSEGQTTMIKFNKL